jgi:hypothetical protein
MTPYYPARDGHPSIFGLEAATKLSPLGTVEATDERDAIAAYRHPLTIPTALITQTERMVVTRAPIGVTSCERRQEERP